MPKAKREFALEDLRSNKINRDAGNIWIGISQDEPPFVCVHIDEGNTNLYMKDRDLERFAVNILKALKSKKLK